jgi:uncharacterized protein YdgA (DUF945 family)
MVRYGVVWCGVHGVVCYGMVWYGTAWYTHPKYRRSFQHFRHESGNTFQLTVSGSHSSQYGVFDGNFGCFTWNKTSNLGHQHSDAHLEN